MTEKSWRYENVCCLWATAHDRYQKKDLCGYQMYLLRGIFISSSNKSRGPSDSPVTQSRPNLELWGELMKYWLSHPEREGGRRECVRVSDTQNLKDGGVRPLVKAPFILLFSAGCYRSLNDCVYPSTSQPHWRSLLLFAGWTGKAFQKIKT